MLSVENIYKRYADNKVLRGVSLKVNQGEVVAVIGPSGSGKSTLLRCLIDLERVDEGRIIVGGETLVDTQAQGYAEKTALRRIILKMGFVFQSFNLFPHFTVLKNVTEAQERVLKRGRQEARDYALQVLGKVGLSDKASEYPYMLSGGQQQRVAIARALVTRPSLLLADEPTGNLDSKTGAEIIELFHELHRSGNTILLITHNPDIAKTANRMVHIFDGKVYEEAVS